MPAATATLAQFAILALAAALAVACAIGMTVVMRPALLERLRDQGDRAMARIAAALNAPHNVDRWFYRRHRIYGASVGLLAIVLLGFLTFGQAGDRWLSAVDPGYRELAALLAQSARIVLWLFGTLALVIATAVFIRPSALKGLEGVVNRWIAPGRSFRGVDAEIRGPDRWATRHPRVWGALVALVSGACLLALVLHADSLTRLGM